MIPLALHNALRRAMLAKNHVTANDIMARLAMAGATVPEVSAVMTAILDNAPHDVRHFWLDEDCPCTKAGTN